MQLELKWLQNMGCRLQAYPQRKQCGGHESISAQGHGVLIPYLPPSSAVRIAVLGRQYVCHPGGGPANLSPGVAAAIMICLSVGHWQ